MSSPALCVESFCAERERLQALYLTAAHVFAQESALLPSRAASAASRRDFDALVERGAARREEMYQSLEDLELHLLSHGCGIGPEQSVAPDTHAAVPFLLTR